MLKIIKNMKKNNVKDSDKYFHIFTAGQPALSSGLCKAVLTDADCHLCTKFENFPNRNCVWWNFNRAIFEHRFPPYVVSTAFIFC